MKLCLNARQDIKYLDYASEIIVNYKDREIIETLAEKYPDKTIVLTNLALDIDWDEMQHYQSICNDNFILKVLYIANAILCQEKNIKCFLSYPICSYDELAAALRLGVQYVRLGPPLFFDLDTIKRYYPKAKIRITPNQAYTDNYPRKTGIYGTWIRPEDINLYDEYAEIIDFNEFDPTREAALVRIYWEEKAWPGELELLIPDLKNPAVNRLIPDELTERRLNCRQMCQANHICHICYRALDLADPERLQEYKDSVLTKYEAYKK